MMKVRRARWFASVAAKRKGVLSILLVSCLGMVFLAGCTGRDKDSRLAIDANGKTVVERYGQLRVIGSRLCTEAGEPVQLRGMCSNGLQWDGKYANEAVIAWLRDDWNSQLWRSVLYLTEGGYIEGPQLKQVMIRSVDAAIACGVYVIIDWHLMRERDPNKYRNEAISFFREMAGRYGSYPNVLYEICSEPNGEDVTWSGVIKPYAEAVIAEIRKIDPDNVIIVGTPTWSQDVDKAADDPITGCANIMYTLHFYTGSHLEPIRAKAEYAVSKGLPIFVTEWGTTLYTGDQFKPETTVPWIEFMDRNRISWASWSVSNDGKESSVLVYKTDREGKGGWKDEQISPSGKFIRGLLRNRSVKRLVKEASSR